MKINRRLRKATGVILIVMFASGALAVTTILDKIDLMRGRETMVFPSNLIEGGYVKATLTSLEFPALFDVLVLPYMWGKEIARAPHSGSRLFGFTVDPDLSTAGALKPAGSDSDPRLFHFLDLDLFRLKGPKKPIPTPALLILVDLIALIALKGRRK